VFYVTVVHRRALATIASFVNAANQKPVAVAVSKSLNNRLPNNSSSLLLSLLIISGTSFAKTDRTVEDFAKLLPSDGKQYELSLTGMITSDRKFEGGELTISDNTKKQLTDEEEKKTESFVECVKKFIKYIELSLCE
jgi:hypothetical protein